MAVRKRALNEVANVIQTEKLPDINWQAGQSKLPETVYEPNKKSVIFS